MSDLTALIDGDTPVWNAAASAEDEPLWVATSRLDKSIEGILKSVGCDKFKIFVAGQGNFRYEIEPNYKANRRNLPQPKWRSACTDYLVDTYGAIMAHGAESDDLCSIHSSSSTIICAIDKDLLQVPGKHFSWAISRKGSIVREEIFREVTQLEGLRTFYRQMLIGDTSDNIIGVSKIGPVKSSKIIDELTTEEDMIAVVKELYNDDKRFEINANLLWILRSPGVTYSNRFLDAI